MFNYDTDWNKRLLILCILLLFFCLYKAAYGQDTLQSLDMVIRNPDNEQGLVYFLYNDNGELLESRNVVKNTTVFASRYESDKYLLEVRKGSDIKYLYTLFPDSVNQQLIVSDNYFYSDINHPDSSIVDFHKKVGFSSGKVTLSNWYLETDTMPNKGFGGIHRSWLGYGDSLVNISYWGFGQSDGWGNGKFWFYNKYDGNWKGFVLEKDFLWLNAYLVFKSLPKPEVITNGQLYFSQGYLWLSVNGVEYKLLDERYIGNE